MWRLYQALSLQLLMAVAWFCLASLLLTCSLMFVCSCFLQPASAPRFAHVFLKPATLPTSVEQLHSKIANQPWAGQVQQISAQRGLEDIKPLIQALNIEKIDTFLLPVRLDIELVQEDELTLLAWQKELRALAIVEEVVLPAAAVQKFSSAFWLLPLCLLLALWELSRLYPDMAVALSKRLQSELRYYRQVHLSFVRYMVLYGVAYMPVVVITGVWQLLLQQKLLAYDWLLPWPPAVGMWLVMLLSVWLLSWQARLVR